MSHVKFLETRRHRAPGGRVTVKYERGKTYPFEAHMRAYLDIGHAELVEGVDATPPPAKAMPPSAMARKAKAAAGDAAPQTQSLERSIPMRDPGPPQRDPVKNGGFAES
jgi:hypothetical protein